MKTMECGCALRSFAVHAVKYVTRLIHVKTPLMIVEPSRSCYVDMRQSMEAETVKKVTTLVYRYVNDFLTGYLVPKDRKTKVSYR